MERIRILIVDDHPLFRKGLRTLLASHADFEVVGEATTGHEAIQPAETLQPDVILMDLQMPGLTGIAATQDILHTSPHIRILMITLFDDEESVFAALRAGARGYIVKDSDEEDIVRAIRAIADSDAIFSPPIATRLIEFFATPHPANPPRAFPDLTERENAVLRLIAQCVNNTEIAARLGLSLKTVRNHVPNIFKQIAGRRSGAGDHLGT